MGSTIQNKRGLQIGIAAAVGMACCDIILLGQAVSGRHYDPASFGAMQHINRARAALGAAGGLVCAFFICFGFRHIKEMFLEASPRRAQRLCVSLCSMMFFAGSFHAGYFFLSNADGRLPAHLVSTFRAYLMLLGALAIPGTIAGSILFYKLASDKRFPKWFRWANPAVLNAIMLGACTLLPSPLGGFIKPAFINIATVVFFLLIRDLERRMKD
jgi:hypothetical protein